MLGALFVTVLCAADVHAIHPEARRTDWFKVRVGADVALPDGLAVGVSLAPLPHVRLTAAGLTNVIGFGARGGVQLVPFSDWTLHPLLSFEAGRYFSGRPVTYDFANVHAGVELTLRRFDLFLIGGLSRIWMRGDLELEGTLPSAKAGVSFRLN